MGWESSLDQLPQTTASQGFDSDAEKTEWECGFHVSLPGRVGRHENRIPIQSFLRLNQILGWQLSAGADPGSIPIPLSLIPPLPGDVFRSKVRVEITDQSLGLISGQHNIGGVNKLTFSVESQYCQINIGQC